MDKQENVCPAHSGLEANIKNLADTVREQSETIRMLQNRLPVWATLIISVLTFALGASLTYAGLAVRLASL